MQTDSYTKTIEVGIEQSSSESSTVTESTTTEVSASFGKFGASGGSSYPQSASSS